MKISTVEATHMRVLRELSKVLADNGDIHLGELGAQIREQKRILWGNLRAAYNLPNVPLKIVTHGENIGEVRRKDTGEVVEVGPKTVFIGVSSDGLESATFDTEGAARDWAGTGFVTSLILQ